MSTEPISPCVTKNSVIIGIKYSGSKGVIHLTFPSGSNSHFKLILVK